MYGKLQHNIFENVALSPADSGGAIYSGGLVNPLEYPKYCRHNRHGRPYNGALKVDTARLPVLKSDNGSPYIFGGTYQYHFGHMIAEFVHRLWVLSVPEYQNCTVLFFAQAERSYILDFFPELMTYLGVKNWKVMTEAHIVDRLVLAEQGKTLGRKSTKQYDKHLEKLARANLHTNGTTPKKIAILRGHLDARRYLCEQHLADYLASQGYHLFYPEKHSIQHQLMTIANATHIVISDGSACHLFDLIPPINAKVAFLARRPKAKLDKISLQHKVRELHSFRDITELIVPNGVNSRPQPTKALLYADMVEIVDFLKHHAFLDPNARQIDNPPYFKDIMVYLEKRGTALGISEKTEDLAIEILSRNLHQLSFKGNSLRSRIRSLFKK